MTALESLSLKFILTQRGVLHCHGVIIKKEEYKINNKI
jgi:hypothetical protein